MGPAFIYAIDEKKKSMPWKRLDEDDAPKKRKKNASMLFMDGDRMPLTTAMYQIQKMRTATK